MKKVYLFIFLGLLLIGFVNAEKEICIDLDEPSPPTNLKVTSSGTNIILIWDAATDVPDCSGIEHYVIWKDDKPFTQTSDLTYTDTEVPYGTYSYIVYAVDKAGHKTFSSEVTITLQESTIIDNPPVVTGTSGGNPSGGNGGNLPENNDVILTEGDNSNNSFEDDNEIELSGSGDNSPNVLSRITGAVIGALGTGGTIGVFVFIVGILGTVIFIKFKKRNN